MNIFRKKQTEIVVDFEQQRQDQLSQIALAFKQARQAQNLNLEVISNKLHIPISILKALENAELDKLPEPIFIKQLLVKYTNYLKIDNSEIEQIIDNFIIDNNKPEKPKYKGKLTINFSGIYLSPKHLYIIYLFLVILSIKSLSEFLQPSQFLTNNKIENIGVNQTNKETNSLTKSEYIESIPAVKTTQKNQETALQKLVLNVSVEDQCWVKVTVDGKTVFEGILNKGTQKQWIANKKLTLRAGNAGGLFIRLNEGEKKKLGQLGQVEEVTFELPNSSQI